MPGQYCPEAPHNFSDANPLPACATNEKAAAKVMQPNGNDQDSSGSSTTAVQTVSGHGAESRPDLAAVEQISNLPVTSGTQPVSEKCGETSHDASFPLPAGGDVRENHGAGHLSARDLEKGVERALILKTALPMLQRHSQASVARAVGVSEATLCRLLRAYGHLAEHQLTPERLAGKSRQCGAKSPWSKFAQKLAVRLRLKQLYLLTIGASSDYMTKDRRTGSAALVLERFADDAMCPPELAALLRAGKFPEPLLRVIREITPEMEQCARGPKHQELNGTLIQRRTTQEILANGEHRQIVLGDWWVFDDMSDNQPFWFLGPDGEPLVGRQGLYAFDILRHWLGVELVGTSRDSYTAAIILRFIRRLMQAIGRPVRGVIFEQSVWKARVISGFRLSSSGKVMEDEFERPEMAEDERNLVQDGLRALGMEVYYTYTPRGKEIEGAFNYLQRVAPTFSENAINIGRHAGEFEQGAKNMRRAHNGSHHPRDLGFMDIAARADVLEKTMVWINDRQARKSNRTGAYPTLAPLGERDLPVFLPSKHEVQIRGGKVTCTVDGTPYDFCHPELFGSLGGGYRLYVKCDPGEPTLGAAIYNRETSSANWKGWPVGQYIGMAEFVPEVARMDFRAKDQRDNTAGDLKKRFNKAVRTEFRAMGRNQFRAGTARDGAGNVAVRTATNQSPTARTEDALALPERAAPRMRVEMDATALQRRRNRLAEEAADARRINLLADS